MGQPKRTLDLVEQDSISPIIGKCVLTNVEILDAKSILRKVWIIALSLLVLSTDIHVDFKISRLVTYLVLSFVQRCVLITSVYLCRWRYILVASVYYCH